MFGYEPLQIGCAPTLEEGMSIALDSIRSVAAEHNYEMTNYCYITIYVRSISEYPTLNRIYGQAVHFQNPPTRVCVECPLPEECHVIMEAIAFKSPQRRRHTISVQESEGSVDEMSSSFSSSTNEVLSKRNTMHVQSISHWAPANIGPYSQSTKVLQTLHILNVTFNSTTDVRTSYFALPQFHRLVRLLIYLAKLL